MRGDYQINDLNPNFPSVQRIQNYNIAYQHLHTFNPTTLNEFRVGLNKVNNAQTSPRSNSDFDPDSLGIGQFPPPSITTASSGATKNRNPAHRHPALWARSRGGERAARQPRLLSRRLRYPSSSSSAEGLTWTAPRQNRYGACFQDEWRATRELTINMGIRWDYFSVPHDVNKKWRSLRLDILAQSTDGRQLPTVVPGPNADFDFYRKDNRYFMPRSASPTARRTSG